MVTVREFTCKTTNGLQLVSSAATWIPPSVDFECKVTFQVCDSSTGNFESFQMMIATPDKLRSNAIGSVLNRDGQIVVLHYRFEDIAEFVENIVNEVAIPGDFPRTIQNLSHRFEREVETPVEETGEYIADRFESDDFNPYGDFGLLNWFPGGDAFDLLLHFDVHKKGDGQRTTFVLEVCSVAELLERAENSVLSEPDHLVVDEYDLADVKRTIQALCDRCYIPGNHKETLRRMERYFIRPKPSLR